MPAWRWSRVGRCTYGHAHRRHETLSRAVAREIAALAVHEVVLLVEREVSQIRFHRRDVGGFLGIDEFRDGDAGKDSQHYENDKELDQGEALSDSSHARSWGGSAETLSRIWGSRPTAQAQGRLFRRFGGCLSLEKGCVLAVAFRLQL